MLQNCQLVDEYYNSFNKILASNLQIRLISVCSFGGKLKNSNIYVKMCEIQETDECFDSSKLNLA